MTFEVVPYFIFYFLKKTVPFGSAQMAMFWVVRAPLFEAQAETPIETALVGVLVRKPHFPGLNQGLTCTKWIYI